MSEKKNKEATPKLCPDCGDQLIKNDDGDDFCLECGGVKSPKK